MFIPTGNRKLIYQNLFKDGVIVARKDFNAPEHDEIKAVPNLQVIKACQSLKSRGYVKEQFAWRHYYYYLTDEGVEYLREYLHLPSEVVPITHKRPARDTSSRPGRERRAPRNVSDRDSYRRGEKSVGVGSDYKPEFRGNYGRGQNQGSGPEAPGKQL